MKQTLTILLLFFALFALAQTDGMSYQAVIISNNPSEIPGVDLTGVALSEAEIEIRFTIVDDAGATDFQEIQATTTDTYGMINVVIGQGIHTGGLAFNQINWDGTPKQLVVEISQEGAGFAEFSRQELLFVPYVYHRNITATGTLDVDGATTLNNTLTVTGANSTQLTGNLAVDGTTDLNSSLNVNNASPTALSGTLNVAQNATLASSLFVQGAQADISGELHVDGDLTANSNAQFNGQVTIKPNLSGSQSNYDAYALRIEGTDQGTAVKLNGSRGASKNYMTFMDGNGTIHGRIEGQTLNELQNSWRYLWDASAALADELFVLAEGVACAFQLDAAEAVVMGIEGAAAYAKLLEIILYNENNVGVLFATGGADYAEYLEKADKRDDFNPGEVVGVYAGKVSKRTEGADHVLVVSTNPIVLGNQPAQGTEENFEQIAFLGQVPTRVIGKVSKGDYIVASGNNDGLAIAFTPDALPTVRYDEIIGIAWEESVNEVMSIVNVAVGLNTNDLANRVASLERRIATIESQLNSSVQVAQLAAEAPLATSNTSKGLGAALAQRSKRPALMSDAEFEAWLSEYGFVFEDGFGAFRNALKENGIDYKQHKDLAVLIDNPIQALRDMRSGKYMSSLWKHFETTHKLN